MKFEKPGINKIEKNELPLNIKESEKFFESKESTVWKILTQNKEEQDKLITLKQVRREAFANEDEMRKDQQFYEFLKSFPEFGKFVPDTLYFKARTTPDSNPQAFRLQRFIEGERIDRLKDDKLYSDPEVVRQLSGFIDAAVKILRATRESKTHKPDFMWTPESSKLRVRLGAVLSDPRYSSNIFIADKPDKNGQRVFFVDTGINVDERTSKLRELHGRYIVSPLHELQFKRWKKKLDDVLKSSFHETQKEAQIKESEFSKQWKRPEKLNLPGGEVEVYDLKPEHQKEMPVVFVPGFGGTPSIFKKDIEVLVENNRRVISINALHGVEHEISSETAQDMPDVELRKVAAIIQCLDAKEIEKVDAVGNSEGGMVIVLAATLYPERFRNIVLENPSGMIGKDRPIRLAVKFPWDIIKSEIEAMRKKELKEAKQKSMSERTKTPPITPRDLVLAFKEVRAMANTQIHELLRKLRNKGIGVSIIHGVDDVVFPMERVQKIAKKDMLSGFYSVKGRHSQIRTEKEKQSYAEIAEHALSAMEKREETKQ